MTTSGNDCNCSIVSVATGSNVCCSKTDRWSDVATDSLDATRKSPLSNVHDRIGRLEFRRRSVGDFHIRQATVVRVVQPRGQLRAYE